MDNVVPVASAGTESARMWVNEWSSESVDRESVWKDLHAMSTCIRSMLMSVSRTRKVSTRSGRVSRLTSERCGSS